MKTAKYKFGIGNKVYLTTRKFVRMTEPCEFCKGTGSIKRNDKKSVPCPVCFGEGTKPLSQSGRMVESVERDKVESVSINVYKEYSSITYILEKNGYKREELLFGTAKEAEESLSTKEAAVGYTASNGFSGSVFNHFFNEGY